MSQNFLNCDSFPNFRISIAISHDQRFYRSNATKRPRKKGPFYFSIFRFLDTSSKTSGASSPSSRLPPHVELFRTGRQTSPVGRMFASRRSSSASSSRTWPRAPRAPGRRAPGRRAPGLASFERQPPLLERHELARRALRPSSAGPSCVGREGSRTSSSGFVLFVGSEREREKARSKG